MTTALSTLMQRLSEPIGDWLRVAVTTNIAANTSIISTNLRPFDGGQDDYFNDWWVYIEDKNNTTVERQISDYATSSGTITVRGANLSADTEAATIQVHRHRRTDKLTAINRAASLLYPGLRKNLDNQILITGNMLPNASFEDWAASTVPDEYTLSSATAAQTTTAGLYRGQDGTSSVKVTASAGNGRIHITSDNHPRLLDLMGKTVSFYCWVSPQVANDAVIQIYTIQADGTAQTLTSTTTNPAGEFTLLALESQNINADIVEIQFRFIVTTDTKYVYFDDALMVADYQYEYQLPTDLQTGQINQVRIQRSGSYDIAGYDIQPRRWGGTEGFSIANYNGVKYLRLTDIPTSERRIWLKGYKPLSTLSAATDTIELDAPRTELLVAKAISELYSMQRGFMSSRDRDYLASEKMRWDVEVARLSSMLMTLPASTLRVR